LNNGAAINEREDSSGCTALYYACFHDCPAVVVLLLERGADPTIANHNGHTPLMNAACGPWDGEVVRLLLGHPSGKTTIDHRDERGRTALGEACHNGRGGIVRALLESGADATLADKHGATPMAIAQRDPEHGSISAEGRRLCVAALQVSLVLIATSAPALLAAD
jgi:uncharacterized protein